MDAYNQTKYYAVRWYPANKERREYAPIEEVPFSTLRSAKEFQSKVNRDSIAEIWVCEKLG